MDPKTIAAACENPLGGETLRGKSRKMQRRVLVDRGSKNEHITKPHSTPKAPSAQLD